MPPSGQPGRRRVIKKVVGHGHHGGAWKIAYADFVTAMMALFLVLWLLASTDQKSREEIAEYFRTGILPDAEMAMNGGAQYMPSIMERSPTPPKPESSSISDDANSVKEAIDLLVDNHVGLAELAGKVQVHATPEGVLIEVADDDAALLFDLASARLNLPLVAFLEALAPVLIGRKETIEIQGHTDARKFVSGADKTNWDLSYDRATAARLILERNGVKAERIVGVIGRGAAVPLDAADPYAAKNRRLSLLLRARPPEVPRGAGVQGAPPPGADPWAVTLPAAKPAAVPAPAVPAPGTD